MDLGGTSIAVIGGGFGGLSTACYLADAGANVTVLEKNDQLGGRASVREADGFRFDMGPSWYLMPDVFERFFGHFDRRPQDFYETTHLDPHYRVFFKDSEARRASGTRAERDEPRAGDRIDTVPDMDENRATFESYEPGAGEALDDYLAEAKRTYEVGMEQFVYTDRSRFRDYLDWDVARHARGLSFLGSMEGHVADYFDHPRLRQVMQYSLVFLGGSPKNTPALYNLMSHVDFTLGVHYPEGGIGAVVDAIAELGRELGVEYRTDAEVSAIRGRAGDFRLETSDGPVATDLVVSDADYRHTEQSLLVPEDRQYDAAYWGSRTYAPSAFLLYLGVERDVEPLAHHSLVLPADWEDHFEQIFERPAWPENPAYYLCAPSKTDDSVAPAGHSALFALVPIAPGLPDGSEARQRFRDQVLDDIAANAGVDLRERIVYEEVFCISDFAGRYNAARGTALGLAHTLRQTGPMRPNRRSSALEGLYFTGSYTTPGIGVPMCLISGEHTAAAIREEYGHGGGHRR